MPRDILLDEWRDLLRAQAVRWDADGGATLDDYRAHWTAPLGGVCVSVGLAASMRSSDWYMVPDVTIGQSGSARRDAYQHARVLRDALVTIERATAVHTMLADHRVYLRDCPCWCGPTPRPTCTHCHGTGLRQPMGADHADD